jgi:hypothetical protein
MSSVRSVGSSKAIDVDQEAGRGNAVLRELLRELALTLVPRGMTPKVFGELSRHAFVHAAVRISRQANGRVNHSRVAALTGLSRAEVKRILLNGESVNVVGRSAEMPIERVLHAWRVDRRFVDSLGNPKRLRISGTSTSFACLAKLYGGDVPHRAVLEELRRIGAVRREGKDVVLTTTRAVRQRRRLTSLSLVLPALIDGIRLAAACEASHKPPTIFRLTIPVKSDLDAKVVRERCLSTVATMLNGLEESLGGQIVPPRSRRAHPYPFVVTVLLAENGVIESVNRLPQSPVRPSRRTIKKLRKT